MDDLRGVRDRERFGDLPDELDGAVDGHAVARDAAQRCAFDELHRHVAVASGHARLVNRDDVRVVQRGGERGFAQQAIERVVAVDRRGPDQFDRDVPAEARIVGAIHLAHAARTELGTDSVRTERSPWSDSHRAERLQLYPARSHGRACRRAAIRTIFGTCTTPILNPITVHTPPARYGTLRSRRGGGLKPWVS
jgi:hypothetical protein